MQGSEKGRDDRVEAGRGFGGFEPIGDRTYVLPTHQVSLAASLILSDPRNVQHNI